jgi:t-SNARE complex subunit (syntaxin)
MCRLTGTEETVRAASKRLTQGMADFNKAITSAKTEEEKTKIVSFVILVDSIISWVSNHSLTTMC